MKKRYLTERAVNLISVLLCTIGFIILQFFTMRSELFGISAFNGVLMACQFALCLVMVLANRKYGIRVVWVLVLFGVGSMISTMITRRIVSPLPGLCNSIIYLVMLTILDVQLTIRDRESVTDFLTKLYNRRGLYKHLKKKIEDKKSFYVIYFEISNYKFLRDTYGHNFGDAVLKDTAQRIQEVVGLEAKIARIAGDEFVVVTNGKVNPKEMALNIIEAVGEKMVVSTSKTDVECYLNLHAGISSYPSNSQSGDDLIKCADIAMYQAAREKKKVCFFDKDVEAYLNRQVEVEKIIFESFENDYFYLVYQPQFDMNGKHVRGYEALLRLKMPDGTMVSPSEFIPVAEKDDLIIRIDDYVLRRAMTEFKEVLAKTESDILLSINVSAKNFGSYEFVDKIGKVLKEVDFPASNLEIEITEYCFAQSVDMAIENINKLKKMGVSVALDDFGTGYTSLSYLIKLPISLLKIDKSLIDDIEKNERNSDFVKTIVLMGHQIGCKVLAEGVEQHEQLYVLEKHECDYVQGFIWSRPIEYEKLVK